MTRITPVFVLCTLLLAGGCYEPEPVPEISTGVPLVEAKALLTGDVDSVMPTDLLVLGGDGYVVLDGYRGRALHLGGREALHEEITAGTWVGAPVRLARRGDGGYWLADPGGRNREAALIGLDSDGVPRKAVSLELEGDDVAPLRPVAVIEDGDALVVGDRLGRVAWIDAESGVVRSVLSEDAAGLPLGAISDLVVLPNGALLAVDPTTAKLHEVIEGGVERSIGRYGLWAGTMKKPKSAAVMSGGELLVADSALGVIQIFGPDGTFLALVGSAGSPLRFEHIVAVRAAGDGRYLALDAMGPSVSSFQLDAAEVSRVAARSGDRRLRFQLEEPSDEVAGRDGRQCRQCHDGFVNDSRSVWDPEAEHHPVDIVPERDLPSFFPLSGDGELVCTTCHSPHGVAEAEDVAGVGEAEERLSLTRHGDAETGFLRMRVQDSALCAACHEEAAHEATLKRLELPGQTHPVGEELEAAMSERPGWSKARVAEWDSFPEQIRKGCLGCHGPHGSKSEPLLRTAGDGNMCSVCHEEQAAERHNHPLGQQVGRDVPSPRPSAQLIEARGGGVLCRTCHDLVGGQGEVLLRRPADGGQLCLVCHDERKGLASAPHGEVAGARGMPCLGCHDLHGGPADRQLLKLKRGSTGDPLGCATCHGPGAPNEPEEARPGRVGHPVVDQPGGLPQSEPPLSGCPSCHDPHLATLDEATACRSCHLEVSTEWERGNHLRAACSDCHPVHTDLPRLDPAYSDLNPLSQGCLRCHSKGAESVDAPKVSDYEHPAPVFLPDGGRWAPRGDLPLFDAAGLRVETGANGDLTCGSCHSTHDARQLADWKESCSACHGRDALPWYLYFHRPEKRGKTPVKDQP